MNAQIKLRGRWWAEAHGYSLVEMLTVMALFGVLAASGLPHIDLRRQDVNNALAEFVADLRFARSRAITSGRHYAIKLDPAGSYQVQRLTQDAGGAWGDGEVGKTVTLPTWIQIEFPEDVDAVEFNTRGMVVAPLGSFEVHVKDTLHDASHTIVVWPSGQVYHES